MAVFISLGSNMGDGAAHIAQALAAIDALDGVRVVRVSPYYRTEPQGYKEQPWFTNAVAMLDCDAHWTPCALVRALLDVEAAQGRVRSTDPALRYGPRCIDLDLLLFDAVVNTDPACTVPHPRLAERAFVLVPLRDIAPEVIVAPDLTAREALRRVPHTVRGDAIYQA